MIDNAKEKLKTFICNDTQTVVDEKDMYVVWSCKALQNFKCLIYTPTFLKRYFELTYNGDKNKWYIDEYQKVRNGEMNIDKKITLKEFWDSKELLAISCENQEQNDKLMQEFDKMGEYWATGDRYIDLNCWDDYRGGICYSNRNGWVIVEDYEKRKYKILKFEDIIFE